MGADAKIDLGKVIYSFFWTSHFTAKADFSPLQNVIEINRPPLPVYQTVIEKTRQCAVRTQALGVTMTRSAQPTVSAPATAKPDSREQPAQVVTVSS